MAQPEHPGAAPGEAAPDPSMDDILASIRRILNEEEVKPEVAAPTPALAAPVQQTQPAPSPPAQAPPVQEPPAPEDDVFELDHSMMVPDPDPLPDPSPAPMPVMAEPEPFIPLPAMMPAPIPMPPMPMEAPPLVAPHAAAAAMTSVNALMRTLAHERSTAVHRGGPTIEDLVREEMRPMLKEWLDTHLPPMVERLVRAEIERVVSRMT